MIGERQKQLLKPLRGHKTGLSVDELSKELEITRNAVRQHLSALEAEGLIKPALRGLQAAGIRSSFYILTG